jgi:hypothetical protein
MILGITLSALLATTLGNGGRVLAVSANGENRQTSPAEPEDRFLVWVQDAKTGIPVEGASVRWFEEPERNFDPDELLGSRMVMDPPIGDELTEGALGAALTDSTGAVFVPMGGVEWMRIEVRKGDLVGEIWRTADTEGVTRIDLVPSFDLEVRVVDENGAPVSGVPVALRHKGSHWPLLEASTSVSGTVELWNAGYVLATRRGLESCSVALDLCLAREVEVPIDPARPPAGPITLVLPPTGEVEVVVIHGDGTAASPRCGVELAIRNEGSWMNGRPHRGDLFHATPVDVGGHLLFRRVGLGTTLVALAQQNCASRVAGSAFWGPMRANERVRVVVDLGWRAVELRARIVDENGQDCADTKLLAEPLSGPPRSKPHNGWINADPDGLVCCSSGTAWTDERGILWLNYDSEDMWEGVRWLLLSRDHDEPNTIACAVQLGQRWSVGRHDLGDIVLRPAPILAAGRVVDDLCVPVSGAAVDIFECKNMLPIRARTDESGSFVLRGAEPLPEFYVSVGKDGYASGSSSKLAPGTLDLTIELPREAVIEGEIVRPAGRLDADLGVTLFWKDSEHSSTSYSERVVGRRFRYDHLAARSYELTVSGVADEPIVHRLELRAGETKHLVFGPGNPAVTEKDR